MDERPERIESQPEKKTQSEGRAPLFNTSGHAQELDRSFGFFSICSIAVLTDNAWAAGGGSLVVTFYNGGGPGVIYSFLASAVFYSFIGLSLAELSSAIPSSANVYHWASITAGPKYGRVCSWFAGWWNALGWVFGPAASVLIAAESVIAMYSLYHPDYVPQRWQFFIAYLVITWGVSCLILFGQSILAYVSNVFGAGMLIICVVTTLLCAILPSKTGYGYASNGFVWTEWNNLTGWSSNGLVFCMGILNGAFTIGTPDAVCHLSEEVPHPRKNIPYGILAQLSIGTVTTLCFYIAILYGITDLEAVFNSPITALPLAAIYQQCVRSQAATFALLFILLVNEIITVMGAYVTGGRTIWTLARDDALPFSAWVRKVDGKWRNPFNAQLVLAVLITILGALYVASVQVFTAIVGCFVIFTTMSYCAAILPHILTCRRYIEPAVPWLPAWASYVSGGVACTYILIFNVLYMFPYDYPATAGDMNFACVLFGGSTLLLSAWYLWKRKHGYVGPQVLLEGHDNIVKGVFGLSKEEEERLRRTSVP